MVTSQMNLHRPSIGTAGSTLRQDTTDSSVSNEPRKKHGKVVSPVTLHKFLIYFYPALIDKQSRIVQVGSLSVCTGDKTYIGPNKH